MTINSAATAQKKKEVVFLSPRRPPQLAFPHNQRLSTRQLWSLRKRGRPTIAYWVKSGVAGWCYKNDLSWIKSTSNPRRAAFRWICPVQGHWKKGGTKSQSEDFISLASAEPQTDVGPTRAKAEQEDSHKKKDVDFFVAVTFSTATWGGSTIWSNWAQWQRSGHLLAKGTAAALWENVCDVTWSLDDRLQTTPWQPCGPSGRKRGCCIRTRCHTWPEKKQKQKNTDAEI